MALSGLRCCITLVFILQGDALNQSLHRHISLRLSVAYAIIFFAFTTTSTALAAGPTLVAKYGGINIYDAPRNGLFCLPGQKLGQLVAGTEIKEYEEVESFCGLFKHLKYLRITYKLSNGQETTAYVNRGNDDGTDRFNIKAQ